MLKTNGECPYCGKGLFNYDERAWEYGSPIRECSSCGEKYIDPRYHEIAVDGIAPDAMSVKKSLMCMAVGLVCALLSAAVMFATISLNGTYSVKMAAICVVGIIVAVFMLFDVIRIKSGAKERSFDTLRRQSEERLADKSYAAELAAAGYNVPEQYL